MTKKQKRHRSRSLDPERVLAGTAGVGAHDLIDLIHRINPTGLELPALETAERYRRKRSLQHQLIARFREQLQVKADAAKPGVITLLYQGRDACHTLLSELDPDARAWAQGYLDRQWLEGQGDQARSPESKPPSTPAPEPDGLPTAAGTNPVEQSLEQLLELGRRAARGYDFETARRLMREALDMHPRSLVAASAYLSLLVDTLGDDQMALALGQMLSRTLSSDPGIRALLGLAAAREGQTELAQSYLKRLRGERAGEAFRTLCGQAIALRDPGQAQNLLEQARERDPFSAHEQRTLSERIAALRQELRQPAEDQFERMFATGDLEQAQQQAEDCLVLWPDSQAARAMLVRIEQVRREEQAESCLREAWAALERQQFQQALAGFQQALALGSPPEALGDGYHLAQRQVEQEQVQTELHRLGELLQQANPDEGLVAYLQAPDGLRDALRNQLKLPMLDWLEALESPHSDARQRGLVQAVLALASAMQALEQGAVEQAANLLSPHRQHLTRLDQANRVWAQIQWHRTEGRRRVALEALDQARQALDQGRPHGAADQLAQVERQVLTKQERQRADRLLQRLRQLEQQRLLEQRLATLLDQGQLLRARALLDQLIALGRSEGRPELLERRLRLSRRIDQQWLSHPDLAPEAQHVLLQLDIGSSLGETALWLRAEHHEMLAAFPVHLGLFVCRLDLHRQECVDYRLVITPEPWQEPLEVVVAGQVVRLADAQGLLLELALAPWEVLSYKRLAEHLPADQKLERLSVTPGGRFCWLESSTDLGPALLRIIDLEQQREHRRLPNRTTSPTPVGASPGWMLLEDPSTGTMSSYTNGGKRLLDYPALSDRITTAAARLADDRLVTLSYDLGWENDSPLVASVQDPRGILQSRLEIAESNGELGSSLAVGGNPQLVFVLYRHPLGQARLMCLRPLAETLQQVYSLTLDPNSTLLMDVKGSQAAILSCPADQAVRLQLLSEQPPRLEMGRTANLSSLAPGFSQPFLCGSGFTEVPPDATLPTAIRSVPDPEVLDWARTQVGGSDQPPTDPIRLVAALLDAGRQGVLEALLRDEAQAPSGSLLSGYASILYDRGSWQEMERLLGPLCSAGRSLDPCPDHAKHLHHLFGMALWQDNRLEEALAVWRRGVDLPGPCELEAYVDLASYFVPSPQHGEPSPADRPLIHDLMSWLQQADRQLQAGDYRGVVRTLDRPLVWVLKETQSLARLSFALLQWEETGPVQDFLRLTALSRLLETQAGELLFPGAWDRNRIEAHSREAEAWIARLVEGGRSEDRTKAAT
jgi:hypothetical protein